MKQWLPAILAALCLTAMPIQAEPIEVLQDPAGDVQLRTTAGSQEDPADRFAAMDLMGMTVEETDDAIAFTISVRDLAAADATPAEGGAFYVDFVQHDLAYRVSMFNFKRDVSGGGNAFRGFLSQYDAVRDSYATIREIPVTTDASTSSLTAIVVRDDIPDSSGASPLVGRELHAFRVTSEAGSSFNLDWVDAPVSGDAGFADNMPDSGTSQTSVVIERGIAQTGDARLFSDEPFRASNGEATTFVFTIMARNDGPDEDIFELTTTGAPANWDVSVPNSLVRIPGGESVQLPILVATPFVHVHGAIETFVAELRSQSDPNSVGRVELGVRFLEVPQPTGHHNVVWLHSRQARDQGQFQAASDLVEPSNYRAFMNANPEDETDEEVPVAGRWGKGERGLELADNHFWRIDLEPRLQIGIDFDMARTGTLEIPVQSPLPRSNAVLHGRLVHIEGEATVNWGRNDEFNVTEIAVLTPSAPMEIGQGETRQVSLEIVPTEAGDFVAHTKHAALRLELFLTSDRPTLFTAAEAPVLLPGGVMTLPLREYHDPVDDIFSSLGVVQLKALEQERMINPGEMALFQVDLINTQSHSDAFELTVHGLNKEWAQLLEPARLRLESGATETLDLAVGPPADATNGAMADLILEVSSTADPNIRSMVRLVATVDTGADQRDDTAAVAGVEIPDEGAPLGFVALFAVLAAGLLARRRI